VSSVAVAHEVAQMGCRAVACMYCQDPSGNGIELISYAAE
jgi:hypothetical protein